MYRLKVMNKRKIVLYLIICTITLSACSVKVFRILSSAKINKEVTFQKTDYSSPLGFIILPIEIKGKTYKFLFDTGAQTTIVSQNLASTVGIEAKGKISTEDSQKKKKKLTVSLIDTMIFEKIIYNDVGVLISDFNENTFFSCLEIDGILGMNVIKLNNWEVNFENKKLTLYDRNNKVFTHHTSVIEFYRNRNMPFVDLYVNDHVEQFLIDTGKNGNEVSISSKLPIQRVEEVFFGYSSLGLFGKSNADTVKYAFAKLSDSSGFVQENVIISQCNKDKKLIGLGFFEERCNSIYFDFKDNKLYLNEKDKVLQPTKYPFSALLTDNGTMVVTATNIKYNDLKIGDTIVAVNEIAFDEYNACNLVYEIWDTRKNDEFITLSVLRNSRLSTIRLPKE